MNRDDLFVVQRLYRVNTWEAPTAEAKAKGGWGKHHQLGIVCHSATQALLFVQTEYPSHRIESVNQLHMVHHHLPSVPELLERLASPTGANDAGT